MAMPLELLPILLCFIPGQDDSGDRYKAMAEEVRQEVTSVIATSCQVRIEDMSRVLKLDDEAIRRLVLAGKGASMRYSKDTEEWIEKTLARKIKDLTGDTYTLNGRVVTEGQQQQEGVPCLAISVSERSGGVWLHVDRLNGSGGGSYTWFGLTDLSEQPLWTKTLSESVIDEQLVDYAAHRKRRLRRAVMTSLQGILSVELSLSDKQEALVAAWLEEHVDVLLPDRGALANVMAQLAALPDEGPEGLSEAQRKLWTLFRADPSPEQR